jgi:hypothetical protein
MSHSHPSFPGSVKMTSVLATVDGTSASVGENSARRPRSPLPRGESTVLAVFDTSPQANGCCAEASARWGVLFTDVTGVLKCDPFSRSLRVVLGVEPPTPAFPFLIFFLMTRFPPVRSSPLGEPIGDLMGDAEGSLRLIVHGGCVGAGVGELCQCAVERGRVGTNTV